MEDIYSLLNVKKDVLQDFSLLANSIVDHQTELAIKRNIRSLKDMEEHMMSDKAVCVSQRTIDEIIQKVIYNANIKTPNNTIFSLRELRLISYYLIKLQGNNEAYEYALGLLGKNWRDMFFNGLSFCCLDSWNLIGTPLRIKTCGLIQSKLQQYHEGNKKYMEMRNHANLFDEAGPKRLALLLTQKGQDIKDAPLYFSNKPSTLSQSYYSDVIVNYCESNNISDLTYIQSIFEIHNSDRTKKLVLADLVSRIDDNGDDVQRSMLCKFANQILGDITLNATWAPFNGATEKDTQKLKRAKHLVNLWFNQKIIETFFEVCVQDRDRKEFWLRYVDRLSGFRIVGSTATKRLLQLDSRISEIFLPYFIATNSYSSKTAALVLFIKNKMIVEFSDTGAVYVYEWSNRMVNLVTKNQNKITKTSDLKVPSMDNLIYINKWGTLIYRWEGRMTHQGCWQEKLAGWLHSVVLSSKTTDVSYFDTENEEEEKNFKDSIGKTDDLLRRIKLKNASEADRIKAAEYLQMSDLAKRIADATNAGDFALAMQLLQEQAKLQTEAAKVTEAANNDGYGRRC